MRNLLKIRQADVEPDIAARVAKILIADDSRAQRLCLAQMLEKQGHQVILASDGQEAYELFSNQQPDLAILDVVMPVMDGIETAAKIKTVSTEAYTPIIFITQFDDEDTLQRCIEIGCDDFLSKPLSPAIVSAKVASLLRMKRLYQDQLEQKQKLLKYQQLIDQEQIIASTLYKNFIDAGFLNTPELKYFLSPLAMFNGDVLLTAKTPGNNLYLFLGDFTGHGLSASIGAGPTAEIFYGMTEKGFGIHEIIVEINRKMLKMLPVNMFLAATMIALSENTQSIALITCGLPDHYLYNRSTGSIETIRSKNLPLGIVDSFAPQEKKIEIDSNHYLYLFTDGIIEAHNDHGQQFGTQGVISCLKPGVSGFENIQRAFRAHTQSLEQQDDMTLVELHCNIDNPAWMHNACSSNYNGSAPLQWKSSMEFHISTLSQIDPVPIMVNSLMEIQGFRAHREAIFMIVSELFSNALEHGLLQLESALKKNPEHFMRYYDLRQNRLMTLDEGSIKVAFSHVPTDKGGELTIKVQDTGEGFNFDEIFSELEGNEAHFGRGIVLVRQLCRSVEYFGNGNRVKAVYAWSL